LIVLEIVSQFKKNGGITVEKKVFLMLAALVAIFAISASAMAMTADSSADEESFVGGLGMDVIDEVMDESIDGSITEYVPFVQEGMETSGITLRGPAPQLTGIAFLGWTNIDGQLHIAIRETGYAKIHYLSFRAGNVSAMPIMKMRTNSAGVGIGSDVFWPTGVKFANEPKGEAYITARAQSTQGKEFSFSRMVNWDRNAIQ
jgi:hypothetical protein